MLRFAGAFALIVICLLQPLAAQERVWTDTQGRTMRAAFLREVDGEAVFMKDGKLLTLPLERFSEADREVMKKLAAGKPVAADGSEIKDPFVPVSPVPPPSNPFNPAPPLVRQKTEVVTRDWGDVAGNRTSGKFVRIVGRDVVILRGTRTVVLAFDTLSFEDQAYVNQVLEARGQRPLESTSTQLAGRAFDGQPQRRPDEVIDPHQTVAAPSADGRVAPGNSQFFRELQQRQDDARQAQAEFAENMPHEAIVESTAPDDHTAAPVVTSVGQSADTSKPRQLSTHTVIKAETLAELRPVFIVGLVVLGLFAAVGVIMFIATSIAASNSARRQRRYL